MSTTSRDAVDISSARSNDSDSRGDNADDNGSSEVSEPTTRSSHAPAAGDGAGSGGGSEGGSGISSRFDTFEVNFPSTGPLGITFEWAADPTAVVNDNPPFVDLTPNSADSAVPIPGSAFARQKGKYSLDAGEGSPLASPRRAHFGPAALPPISSSPLSARREHLAHMREPPLAPPALPHALRIQSFPQLPAQGTTSLCAGNVRTAGTAAATGHGAPLPVVGERQLRDRTTTTGLLNEASRASADGKPHLEGGGAKSSQFPSRSISNVEVGKSSPKQGSEIAGESPRNEVGGTEPREGTTAFGPVAGRDLLRPGDILVEVNGTPVAGLAAREAGIRSFEDAVRVVAAATAKAAPTVETSGQTGDGPHQRPRVFKFRRVVQQLLRSVLASDHAAPSLTFSKDPSKGGWVRGMSALSSARSKMSSGLVAEPDTRDVSMDAGSKRADGRFTSTSLHLSPRLDASSADADRLPVPLSSRSRGSVSSMGSHTTFMNRGSSKGGEATRTTKRGGRQKRTRDGSSVFSVSSAATRIKAEARRGEALREPLTCPRQQLLKRTLETNTTLRPLAVRLTNLSYWYQQRRLLGGSRHMHRRAVFDPRSKRWEASIYMLGDRPSDGKLVPILTPIKTVATTVSTEGQALALAAKSAKERDANPGAVRGPKPPGLNQLTLLQTHISVLVVSDAFSGLSHADRLALVFTALHDELAAQAHPGPSPLSPCSTTTTISPILSPKTSPPSLRRPAEATVTETETPEKEATVTKAGWSRVGRFSGASSADGGSTNRGHLSPQHTGEESKAQAESGGAGPGDETSEGGPKPAAEETKGEGERERGNGETRTRKETGNEGEKERGGSSLVGGGDGGGTEGREDVAASNDVALPVGPAQLSRRVASPGGTPPSVTAPGRDNCGIRENRRISNRQRTQRRQKHGQHGVIRGCVKASFVGDNVQALPVWGALDAIAGTSLLVDCRTPAQWRPEEYRPTAQELWGPARSGHRTIANNPRVQESSVRRSMERVMAESKVLREAAPKFEHFDRFKEDKGSTGGGDANPADRPPAQSHKKGTSGDVVGSPTPSTKNTISSVAPTATAGRTQHPHFFHGLGPNARKLFMELYAENRSRLLAPISRGATGRFDRSSTPSGQQHQHHCAGRPPSAAPSDGSSFPNPATVGNDTRPPPSLPGGSQRPLLVSSSAGGAADTVRHAAGAFAASGPPPDLDAAILDRYGVLLGRISEAATRIQRVRRLGGLPRAARRLRRRQRAALAVQRVFRGHLSRRYATIWKVVTALASTRLSAGWRRFTVRRKFLVFRARARAGAIGLQALFRGHVARRYAAWCAAHYFAARHIQRGARGFILRCCARRKRATRAFQLCGLPAILLLQKIIRGFLVRKAYERRFEEAVRVRVIVPAAGVLQKCWRGKKGREQGALRRQMWAAATEIQRHVRGLSKRMWWTRVLRCRLEHAMATKIAALGRGYIDRELMKARAERRRFLHTIVPASILIQSQWRGYTKRRDLAKHKQRWLAALFIQVAYRGAVFRRHARCRYQEWLVRHRGFSATKIQCLFRKWRSRQLYRVRNVEASWRRTFATRIILRSWRSYKLNLAMDELKEQWRVQKAALELADAQRAMIEIKRDLHLCNDDIASVKKSIKTAKRRMKDLTEFRKEAAIRLVRVEKLIENLTVQDMSAGWGENYDREWDMLTNCASMAIEEERIIKVKIAKLERDLEILKLEIDDQEADLDAASVKEFDRMESLRRMEIKRGLALAARDRCRAVRREKMRWAVRDVRRNVIKRSRKDLQRYRELARAERPLEVEQTISYEKRRDQERDEEAEVRRMEREARKTRFEELKKKGEGSLAVREIYDSVISGVRDILATATFDARRSKQDYRGRGPDEVGPAASAAATAAASAARNAAIAAASRRTGRGGGDDAEDTAAVENAAAAAAAAAAVAAAATGGAEPGGGKVCRECGGPRFGRTVCAKCGANANSWRGGASSGGSGGDGV